MTYFGPALGSAPGRIWPKNNNTCKGPWVLHPYQVSSKSIWRFWRRSRKCEKFTDGWTTDRGQTLRYDNSSLSLRLRWAKNTSLVEDVEILLLVKFCLAISQEEMSKQIRGHGSYLGFLIGPKNTNMVEDASCQISLNFLQRFYRSVKKIMTDDGRSDTVRNHNRALEPLAPVHWKCLQCITYISHKSYRPGMNAKASILIRKIKRIYHIDEVGIGNPRGEPLSLDRVLAGSRREVYSEGFPILTLSTWLIIYLAYFFPKPHFNQIFFICKAFDLFTT